MKQDSLFQQSFEILSQFQGEGLGGLPFMDPKESAALSLCEIHDGPMVRNRREALQIANAILDEKGYLAKNLLENLIEELAASLYSSNAFLLNDAPYREHLIQSLRTLHEQNEVQKKLREISTPFRNPLAESLIRESLYLGEGETLLDRHARLAALAAFLTRLRQSVGSCFATAPCIVIQRYQPVQFFEDINKLFEKGYLVRILDGTELHALLAPSWGLGELKQVLDLRDKHRLLHISPGFQASLIAAGLLDPENSFEERGKLSLSLLRNCIENLQKAPFDMEECLENIFPGKKPNKDDPRILKAKKAFALFSENPLLKSWEFTIASFVDSRSKFSQWNLYSSLGLEEKEEGGIGACIKEEVTRFLDEAKQEIDDRQLDYEAAFQEYSLASKRLSGASSKQEANYIEAEVRRLKAQQDAALEDRDRANERGQKISNLYASIANAAINKFPVEFQEVYDPEMQEVEVDLYHDSPAGFRLLFKHGRSNPSAWSLISGPEEFQSALADFFVLLEHDFRYQQAWEDVQREIATVITRLVHLIRSPAFLEGALNRMQKAHGQAPIKDPLNNLHKVQKKPWAHVSGGTVDNLVQSYFERREDLNKKEKWVESPTELLSFYLETLKDTPSKNLTGPNPSLLAYSPTHVFTICPRRDLFQEGWEHRENTFTWIRDRFFLPRKFFYERLELEGEMIARLGSRLEQKLQHSLQDVLKQVPRDASPTAFRRTLLQAKKLPPFQIAHFQSQIDQVLYASLPLTPKRDVEELLKSYCRDLLGLSSIPGQALDSFLDPFPYQHCFFADELPQLCLNLGSILKKTVSWEKNILEKTITFLRGKRFLAPAPLVWADSNWQKYFLCFVTNPGSEETELWICDHTGLQGLPLIQWNEYLNGSNKMAWGLYDEPNQYGQ